ncbi:4'-phosphopantetheinyl transferase family protein [Clostridium saccharobutylicum]|uniref:4'-phosphopantetheinyl transferase family protein n=1 Tax=Clostridium saccharobutylicum DSM 13864 TaxID=1345695 RepID=U5MSP8_CLOSA|nr:4'-phosphopantetheinyl transferase superfamily protein [Clostridium saccharobutylicum]AGX42686.1 4'-phosphopantetheinyl transferase family protein [Clostridium saccharobutylicum DSM 13864]AQR89978.1 4'-phosphopantetheinyl transferase sfp [Clostridium saccharobutylicum]AQR99883.1 4'-phosphopantetheinyl transferase sfp [Clostridium saccharobutylicum]AQS09611.1 4'-phosphopantetheinyl transferase sfp [Clostridium saccharobutylicum]AQS13867.1 4'-phosphopantetheinyl transferase sfp [Clostridium s
MKLKFFTNKDLFQLSQIQLQEQENHVWIICWKDIAYWINSNKNVLNEKELKKAEKFYFLQDKMRYMTGRILTKNLSAHYLLLENKGIHIKYNSHGKPLIVSDKKKIYYNISHSGDYVLLAFTYDGEIGIDVEEEKWIHEYKELSREFHKEEYEHIYKTNDIHIFYKFWTAKEAYVKAVGQGLQIKLNSFCIRDDGIYKDDSKLDCYNIFIFRVAYLYTAALVVSNR